MERRRYIIRNRFWVALTLLSRRLIKKYNRLLCYESRKDCGIKSAKCNFKFPYVSISLYAIRSFHPQYHLESYLQIETYKYLGKIYFASLTTQEFVFKQNAVLAFAIFNAISCEILCISQYALSYSMYM